MKEKFTKIESRLIFVDENLLYVHQQVIYTTFFSVKPHKKTCIPLKLQLAILDIHEPFVFIRLRYSNCITTQKIQSRTTPNFMKQGDK